MLEILNIETKLYRRCSIFAANNKGADQTWMRSCAVPSLFPYAKSRFSHEVAHVTLQYNQWLEGAMKRQKYTIPFALNNDPCDLTNSLI